MFKYEMEKNQAFHLWDRSQILCKLEKDFAFWYDAWSSGNSYIQIEMESYELITNLMSLD